MATTRLRLLAIEPDGAAARRLQDLVLNFPRDRMELSLVRTREIATAVFEENLDLVFCTLRHARDVEDLGRLLGDDAPPLVVVSATRDLDPREIVKLQALAVLDRPSVTESSLHAVLNKLVTSGAQTAKQTSRHRAQAKQLLKLGKTVEAADCMVLAGDYAEAGKVLMESGRWSEAVSCFRKTHDWRNASQCLFKAGRPNEGFHLLTRATSHESAAKILWEYREYYYAALVLEGLRLWREALSGYIQLKPEDRNFRSACRRAVALAHATGLHQEMGTWLRGRIGETPPCRSNMHLYTCYITLLVAAKQLTLARRLAMVLVRSDLLSAEQVAEYFQSLPTLLEPHSRAERVIALQEIRDLIDCDMLTPPPDLDRTFADGDTVSNFRLPVSLDERDNAVRIGCQTQIAELTRPEPDEDPDWHF